MTDDEIKLIGQRARAMDAKIEEREKLARRLTHLREWRERYPTRPTITVSCQLEWSHNFFVSPDVLLAIAERELAAADAEIRRLSWVPLGAPVDAQGEAP